MENYCPAGSEISDDASKAYYDDNVSAVFFISYEIDTQKYNYVDFSSR